ncbi:ATP-binding protein [Rhodococcus sp. B10]|uniref:ATP-binding protein n=1 Tax=Rhodococcus sp. B10 TaxID=2695876 RepID=UPI00143117EC|nr:ATP-binding protein [Rhodococcus sp. B10]
MTTNLTIEFSHPVTALVGPNGSNKTAILRAMQGSPSGNDLGNYWFGTAMDEIPSEARHRFIYGRQSQFAKRTVEVVKTRIGRRNSQRSRKEIDPDLFEPSRPLTSEPDNMEKYTLGSNPYPDGSTTRWNTISKPVVYLDFRSQLSAFDWAFHHSELNNQKPNATEMQLLRARKVKIRTRAKRLAYAIEHQLDSDVWYSQERIISPISELSAAKLGWVNEILGKNYRSVRLIKHRYFGSNGGWTILVRASEMSYSEAFAGSGEFAAVMLVNSVLDAKPKSLILLDEPEVSLHPSAQSSLIEFLCEASKKQKHQIVFATHSPELVRPLPANAVKVLTIRNDDGKVDLPSQKSSSQIAFQAVGASFERPTIVVEDRLAKALVERSIRSNPVSSTVQIKHIPGGATTLWKHYVPMWAHDERDDLLLILDGDQKCDHPPKVEDIPDAKLETELARSLGGNEAKLPYGSTETDSAENRKKSVIKVLTWRKQYVEFLPCETPEDFLWNFRSVDGENDEGSTLKHASDIKLRWKKYVESQLGLVAVNGEQILTLQLQALARVPADHPALAAILAVVTSFAYGVNS